MALFLARRLANNGFQLIALPSSKDSKDPWARMAISLRWEGKQEAWLKSSVPTR